MAFRSWEAKTPSTLGVQLPILTGTHTRAGGGGVFFWGMVPFLGVGLKGTPTETPPPCCVLFFLGGAAKLGPLKTDTATISWAQAQVLAASSAYLLASGVGWGFSTFPRSNEPHVCHVVEAAYLNLPSRNAKGALYFWTSLRLGPTSSAKSPPSGSDGQNGNPHPVAEIAGKPPASPNAGPARHSAAGWRATAEKGDDGEG